MENILAQIILLKNDLIFLSASLLGMGLAIWAPKIIARKFTAHFLRDRG